MNAKWLKKDLTHAEAQEFTKDVLNHMRERLSDYQEQYGDLYNLEATPAESTSFRLAKHDKSRFGDIVTASENGTPYYTNSSHLPVNYTDDIFTALDVQDKLQTLYTSGTVFHAFLGEKLPDWQAAANLVRKIAENYKLPYYSMSPTYSICHNHGYIAGEEFKCPECGSKTEVYSRITGYYRPVQNWNDGKAQEYKDRKVYNAYNALKREFTSDTCCCSTAPMVAAAPEAAPVVSADKLTLFTTTTCPNCRIAKRFLDDAGIEYEVVVADQDEAKAREFQISHAPTLVISNGKDAEKLAGISAIRKYIDGR